ncbi:MAG: zinc ribbon domain-containing protein [Thomasclavelia sp.]|nr:zinc ribbon domain-containing protein [Thomasclavelia sp.]
MKTCPRCHRQIPDDAKVCPYCGLRLVQQAPQNRRKPSNFGLILIILCVISPLISLLFYWPLLMSGDSNSSNSSITEESNKNYTLGTLGDVKNDPENIEATFYSINRLDNQVDGSQDYCKALKASEKKLNSALKNANAKITSSDYTFQITNLSNIYADIRYDISVNKEDSVTVELSYDLSGTTNSFTVTQIDNNLKNFEAIKASDSSLVTTISKLYDNKDHTSIIALNDAKVDKAEDGFNERKNHITNYGYGFTKTKDDSSTREYILGQKNNYRTKIIYESKLNIKKITG